MTWVRLDDQFFDHPKVAGLPADTLVVFLSGLCYANRHLTDGFIPSAVARKFLHPTLGGLVPRRHSRQALHSADLLVQVGLWEPVAGGYQIHDYLQYQDDRETVKRRRAKTAERQRRWRNGVTNGVSNGVSNGAPTPTPTPTPTPYSESGDVLESSSEREYVRPADQPHSLPLGLVVQESTNGNGFEEFWRAYPRHTRKKAAADKWKKLKPDTALKFVIAQAVERWKGSRQWQEGVVPHAVTWLNQAMWEDELAPAGESAKERVLAEIRAGIAARKAAQGGRA